MRRFPIKEKLNVGKEAMVSRFLFIHILSTYSAFKDPFPVMD